MWPTAKLDWEFSVWPYAPYKSSDDLSDFAYITNGVVQGSCLGAILFVLFINDLPDVFTDAVTLKLYADDVKLYSNIKIPV